MPAFAEQAASQAVLVEWAVDLLDGSEPVSMAVAWLPALVLAQELGAWTAGPAQVSTVAVECPIQASASAYPASVEAMECLACPASKALVVRARDCPGDRALVSELVSASEWV